jgi:3-oxoacyl-[acyl-carrier protein] reductase
MAIYYAAAGLAERARPYGIRVNRVAPGLMLTNEATRRQWAAYGADRQRALVEGIALRRLGCARDVVNAVVFLASDLSTFITGQHLGWTVADNRLDWLP